MTLLQDETIVANPASHSQRVARIVAMPPWQRLGLNNNFDDPFTVAVSSFKETIWRSRDYGGVFAANRSLDNVLTKLHELFLSVNYAAEKFATTLDLFPEFEKCFLEAQTIGLANLKRARADHRKDRIGEYNDSVKRNIQEIQSMYARLSPAHLLIQRHFWEQVLRVPRGEHADSLATTAFYEPLYALRDQYFYEPEPSVLQEYLSVFRELISDDYYFEHVIFGVDPQELTNAQTAVDEFTIDLEVSMLLA